MRRHLILRKVIKYVSRRKLNFCLTTIIIVIALYLLSMALQTSVKSKYYMIDTKNVFSENNILNLNILMTEQDSNDYYDNVYEFLGEMEQTYGSDYGKYMYITTNYVVGKETQNIETLYVDKNMFDLCNVKFNTDEDIKEKLEMDKTLLGGYVCKNKLSEYPMGTILENNNLKTKTIIVGYYEVDSKWAPRLLLHSQVSTINLNDYIVTEMDESYFEASRMFYGNVFNSVYIRMKNGKSINEYKNEIKNISQKNNVKCYINTIDELIKNEKKENEALMKALGTMVVFSMFVALTGILASFLSDVSSWQKEISIMYINGVAPMDVFLIILFENLIKSILGLNVAIYLYGHKLEVLNHAIYFGMVVPTLIIGTVICIFVFSYIAFWTVKQDRLLMILGGERL